MPTQVTMPQLGESVVEGTVGRWLIAEGQPVNEYEPLVTITTDKVDTEIPAPASGVLLRILVPDGQTVPAGTPLAWIGGADEAQESTAGTSLPPPHALDRQPVTATPIAQRMAAEHGVDLALVPGTGPGGRVTKEDVEAFLAAVDEAPVTSTPVAPDGLSLGFISPAVGHLAAELGVDLTQVVGTGTGGRTTKKDVLAYIAAPVPRDPALTTAGQSEAAELPPWERPGTGDLFKPTEELGVRRAAMMPAATSPGSPSSPDDSEIVPLTVIRRSIARHMVLSKQTAPHVTTLMEADLSRVVKARERLRGEFGQQGVRLTLTPFFLQAVVVGLKTVPEVNSSFTENGLLMHKRIHIGIAVAVPDGLIVPVIRDADEKNLLGLARVINDLTERARAKKLAPEEVQGGTFTVTNHGTSGSLLATPIINQPQAGILGIGAVQKRIVIISQGSPLLPNPDDAIAIRPMVYLSFTFDHRILDGQSADRFLMAVKQTLEGYAS